MLYTGKGDNGTTKTISSGERISKGSPVAESLGALDEINSFLGLCKVKADQEKMFFGQKKISDIVHDLQETLFIIQAELAGADKRVSEEKVKNVERIIDGIEKTLPPIKSFFISGGTEMAALFDVARTISRRAERNVVKMVRESEVSLGEFTLPYLNRLSSILYALARLSNHISGINEKAPRYE